MHTAIPGEDDLPIVRPFARSIVQRPRDLPPDERPDPRAMGFMVRALQTWPIENGRALRSRYIPGSTENLEDLQELIEFVTEVLKLAEQAHNLPHMRDNLESLRDHLVQHNVNAYVNGAPSVAAQRNLSTLLTTMGQLCNPDLGMGDVGNGQADHPRG